MLALVACSAGPASRRSSGAPRFALAQRAGYTRARCRDRRVGRVPGAHRVAQRCRSPPASASSAAASACCPASGACACRCRGPACRTATPGRSPPATGSCSSTCGMHEPGSFAHLERALGMVNLRIENVRLLVCTHAHSDHYGQAATIIERTGCELWMHPNHEHMTRAAQDPDAGARAAARGRAPERRAGRAAARLRGLAQGPGLRHRGDRPARPRLLVDGRRDPHRPRHVEGRRDAGPRALARLPLPGGPPHPDLRRPPARPRLALLRLRLLARPGRRVPELARRGRGPRHAALPVRPRAHVHRRRRAHHRQPASSSPSGSTAACACSASSGPITAFEAVPLVYGQAITAANANWWLSETLCYLRHLEVTGRAERVPGRGRRARALAAAA